MKKNLLTIATVLVGLVSCTTSLDENVSNDGEFIEYDITIAEQNELNQLNSYLSENNDKTAIFKLHGLDRYDLSQAEIVRPSSNPRYSVLSVKPKEHSLVEKEALTFLRNDKDEIKLQLITKAVTVNDNIKDFRYINVLGQTQFTVRFDNNQKRVIYLDEFGDEIAGVPNDWGDRTVDCFSDVYSNHGWLSLWASVQTAFLPQTAAAFAVYCAVINYEAVAYH